MPTPIVSRTSKYFAFAVFGAAGLRKLVEFNNSTSHGRTMKKVASDFGAVCALGTLSFSAAMTSFSQTHVKHALGEVVMGQVREFDKNQFMSVMRSAGGRAGCLTLLSFGILKASHTVAHLPSDIDTMPLFFVIPFLFPVMIPAFIPAYVGGAVVGQLLGRHILRTLVAADLLQGTGGLFGVVGSIYSTHPWLSRICLFGTAAIAYWPTHPIDNNWKNFSESSENGPWSYRRSIRIYKDKDHSFPPYSGDNSDNAKNDSGSGNKNGCQNRHGTRYDDNEEDDGGVDI